jgi:hypothetical protein
VGSREIDALHFPSQRIICLDGRVAEAFELAFDLTTAAIAPVTVA